MKLNKRECNVRIRLTPFDWDFLKVQFNIDGKRSDFFLSSIMGSSFSSFLSAVYCLYEEEDFEHFSFRRWNRQLKREVAHNRADGNNSTRAEIHWDGEGYGCATVILQRVNPSVNPIRPGQPDPVDIIFLRRKNKKYTIDGRDLCYAVAKACTEALKKYGFKGFLKSNSGYYIGDSIDIEELLFIKAYALGVLDVRKTETAWENPRSGTRTDASSFEKEMELLMFDM